MIAAAVLVAPLPVGVLSILVLGALVVILLFFFVVDSSSLYRIGTRLCGPFGGEHGQSHGSL